MLHALHYHQVDGRNLVPLGFDFLDTIQVYGFGDAVWNRQAGFGEVERETLRRELAHAQQSQVSPGWWRRWRRGVDHA